MAPDVEMAEGDVPSVESSSHHSFTHEATEKIDQTGFHSDKEVDEADSTNNIAQVRSS